MPTSRNQTVDRTRLLLIHTIITGYRVNIGEILTKQLAAACANDKGILAFCCLISALCRRAAVPTSPGDKYQAEKTRWTRAVYMGKMDVADVTPLNVAMPTPPTSPIHMPATDMNEAESSVPAEAPPAPVDARKSQAASPPVGPVSNHTTTTSPATTPAAMPTSRATTPDSPLGTTPDAPPSSPPPAQSEEAAPIHILQLRNQLQRIEARQLQMHVETKVFQQNLITFLSFQFPAATVVQSHNIRHKILAAQPFPLCADFSLLRERGCAIFSSSGKEFPDFLALLFIWVNYVEVETILSWRLRIQVSRNQSCDFSPGLFILCVISGKRGTKEFVSWLDDLIEELCKST
ncbi:hypothetical protein V6N11_061106 [Hibiscus sabdariffa]|uniref:Uncharacterized protein n=1 Tax=Hibiscus sabdariffa TaxID=183260 RepID=A0ABR2PIR9_9ROSI